MRKTRLKKKSIEILKLKFFLIVALAIVGLISVFALLRINADTRQQAVYLPTNYCWFVPTYPLTTDTCNSTANVTLGCISSDPNWQGFTTLEACNAYLNKPHTPPPSETCYYLYSGDKKCYPTQNCGDYTDPNVFKTKKACEDFVRNPPTATPTPTPLPGYCYLTQKVTYPGAQCYESHRFSMSCSMQDQYWVSFQTRTACQNYIQSNSTTRGCQVKTSTGSRVVPHNQCLGTSDLRCKNGNLVTDKICPP